MLNFRLYVSYFRPKHEGFTFNFLIENRKQINIMQLFNLYLSRGNTLL